MPSSSAATRLALVTTTREVPRPVRRGRFRQIQTSSNNVRFEINPDHVNVRSSLRIGGASMGTLFVVRPWVRCLISTNLAASSNAGRVRPTVARTSGQAAGAYDITSSSHPRGFDYTVSTQVRVDSRLAFVVVRNIQANSLKDRTYNASRNLTDLQLSLTEFA